MIVTDNITLNIFKLLGYIIGQRDEGRGVVLSEGGNFPTDGYIAQGFSRFGGHEHRFLPEGAPLEAHLDGVDVVVLSQVNYRTGALRDMAAVTRQVHAHGAEIIWDLAHSAGALPVDLNGCGARYAVGCTYKYLNGGLVPRRSCTSSAITRTVAGSRFPAGTVMPRPSTSRRIMPRPAISPAFAPGPTRR